MDTDSSFTTTASSKPKQTKTVRILPLGDSITAANDAKGYRYHLYRLLKNAGYDFDFVGSQRSGSTLLQYDRDHEGHSGWKTEGIQKNIDSWLRGYQADIVLLHIGTDVSRYASSQCKIFAQILKKLVLR